MVEQNQSASDSTEEKQDEDIDSIESLEDMGLELVDKLPGSIHEEDEAEPSIDEFQISKELPEEAKPTLDDLGIAISTEENRPEAASNDEWFLQQFGQTLGPFPYEHLVGLVEENALGSEDQIRRGVDGPWIEAGSIEGLIPEEEDFELGGGVEIKEDGKSKSNFEVIGGASNRLLEKSPTPPPAEQILVTNEDSQGLEDVIDENDFDEPIDFESLPAEPPEKKGPPKPKQGPRKPKKITAKKVDDIIDDVLNNPASSPISEPEKKPVPAPVSNPMAPPPPTAPVNPTLPPKPTQPTAPTPKVTPAATAPLPPPNTTAPAAASKPVDNIQTPAAAQAPTSAPAAYKPPPPPKKKKSSGGSLFSGIGNPFSGMSMPSASLDPKILGGLGAVIVVVLGIYLFPMLGDTNDQEIYARFQEIYTTAKSGKASDTKPLIAEVESTISALERAGAGAAKPIKQNLLSAGKYCLIPLLESGKNAKLEGRFEAHMKLVETSLKSR